MYNTTVILFKISIAKKYPTIDMKRIKQTVRMKDKIGIIISNSVISLSTSIRYRLIKNIKDSNNGRIYEGTSEIMKVVIANQILKGNI